MSEFSIKTDEVRVIAQEITDVSKKLNIYKSQCEDILNSLALPYGAGASVRANLSKSISELEEEITDVIIFSESLNEIAVRYKDTEKRIIEYPQQKAKKPKREKKESQLEVNDAEQDYDWDTMIESFMNTWLGEGLTMASTMANPFFIRKEIAVM